MLFRRISHRIALQFTAFVFLLFVINGFFFFAADSGNALRQTRFRLERMAEMIAARYEPGMQTFPLMPRGGIPPHMMAQIRILDAEGTPLISGSLFDTIPTMQINRALSRITIDNAEYVVLTAPLLRNGQQAGFVQIADIARFPHGALPGRIELYLLISIAVSALTYGVGLFFARRSLRPARQMMERLEQFTQDASHELKTPLTAVGTSIDLALLKKDQLKHLRTAKKELADMSALIDRLLELARLDSFVLQTEPVDLTLLVTDVIDRHRAIAERQRVHIARNLAPNVVMQGDPSLLKQVVANLLSNAIKFNKPNGTVHVSLSDDALRVEDTGKGISSSALPHIFDRFYQEETSRSKPGDGVGLGLALVKRIVELHGWTIDAQSTQGKGTIFTVRFS